MQNNTNQEIRIGGEINKQNTPTDLEQIKHFLKTLKEDLINLTIINHSKKKNTYQEANYRPKNQTLFIDPKILEEIKKYKIDIIKAIKVDDNTKLLLNPSTPLKTQNNTLKHQFNIFQINYKNETKNQIKELMSKININKLDTLKLFKLDNHKKDKYDKPLKSNYKKGLNIIYYRLEDLKHIKFFITKDKRGYRIRKLHPKYKYISKTKQII
ncbi:hypothetical protein LFWB_5790 [Candidatus Phytoplasma luffae]|uniref:Phase variable surface lipoprotein n=1 Tax=Loofah witches'-broom phytoplasma TaxID=35773 RepID=A0A975FJH5_LOWBP|nr:phase variable surface lipoprotein [Candidatus Phytoplasma luffae]QTX02615.1 hypothetical protein LFWB_0450 [Candidatus Phytoplasma luffae]QTX02897.1 hypothetical protein LFWB_3270 [Candidatus Phytoplasma luffae]QTX03004.1 hypothetical protein LFWB_4380 [Candidatus Phytoplasma luffae]QTX03077.1 hypothetical protein LFWB_5110 [Candidatus Phytoplasma luffae]QTX03122.1 hypothetical protein LFWB_5560 [Candidatus Phytoplasma luffae]